MVSKEVGQMEVHDTPFPISHFFKAAGWTRILGAKHLLVWSLAYATGLAVLIRHGVFDGKALDDIEALSRSFKCSLQFISIPLGSLQKSINIRTLRSSKPIIDVTSMFRFNDRIDHVMARNFLSAAKKFCPAGFSFLVPVDVLSPLIQTAVVLLSMEDSSHSIWRCISYRSYVVWEDAEGPPQTVPLV